MSYIAIVTLLVTILDAGLSAFIIPTTIGATVIAAMLSYPDVRTGQPEKGEPKTTGSNAFLSSVHCGR